MGNRALEEAHRAALVDAKSVKFWANCMATTCAVVGYRSESFQPVKRGRNLMTLFKVFVIDRYKGVLLSEHTVIGVDEGEAALNFSLTDEERKIKSKDDLEIIWQRVGEFEKREVQRTRVEKDED